MMWNKVICWVLDRLVKLLDPVFDYLGKDNDGFDTRDRGFMAEYDISEEEMHFFRLLRRRELLFKRVIRLLALACIALALVLYYCM